MQNILEADSIRKTYGDKQILTDIYIKLHTGDIIGILGRNGSGKSTLLKILFGTLHTDYKHITINGELFVRPYETVGTINFLYQDNFLPKNMIVNKIIELFNHQLNLSDFKNDIILKKILDSKVGNLSGGELRYLEIKLILNADSKFVLLDEPFNGLSPIQTEKIKECIRYQSHLKGIILTDHDYRNVFDVANKYMIMFDGALKTLKTKEDFIHWGYLPDK